MSESVEIENSSDDSLDSSSSGYDSSSSVDKKRNDRLNTLKFEKKVVVVLSPISEIASYLEDASLNSTPTTSKKQQNRIGE